MVEGHYRRLTAILRASGYAFNRDVKGSYECWIGLQTGITLEVPRCCSRERASELLKQAGIQKHF